MRHLPFSGEGLADVASLAAKREKADFPDAKQYETGLVSLCRSINLTLRGFQVETGTNLRPQEVFITGPGALVPATAEILGKELELKIANMHLGRDQRNGAAIVLLEIDEELDQEDIDTLRALPNINDVQYLHFPAIQ